jgi:hypothetical protein
MLKLGYKLTPIGIDDFLVKCPSCEKHSWAEVTIFSRYIQLYRIIPFFPVDKETIVTCKTCGLERYEMSFGPNLISNYKEIKNNYKHPLFTYTGFIALLIFLIVIFSLIISGHF